MLNVRFRRRGVSLWQRIYRLYGVRANVHLGDNVSIGIGSVLWAPRQMQIGANAWIGKWCSITCNGTIGEYFLCANLVGIIGRREHDHHMVGTPTRWAGWIGDPSRDANDADQRVEIEDDVWIGYGAIVLGGIRIGRGAVVAAGSVVTSDIPPYAIVAGVPARVRHWRFSRDQICEHEEALYGAIRTPINQLPPSSVTPMSATLP